MMDNKKIRALGSGVLVAVWLVLTGFAWFGPKYESSDSERRPLNQLPQLNEESWISGSFMTKFEKYSLDQFPLRDTFRQLKSLYHYHVMQYKDNNKIYIHDGYAVQQEYPVNEDSLKLVQLRFDTVYQRFLKDSGSQIYLAIVPDKNYYLGEQNGYLSMDYEAFFEKVQTQMPWATPIQLTDTLEIEDYYYTDTHWRQERLFEAAQKICDALGADAPDPEMFCVQALERPFYGVYYGQAAYPMEPDTMYLLESDMLSNCTTSLGQWDMKENKVVYNKLYDGVYDMEKLAGKDMYEMYLSGSESLLRIDNPNATSDRELIVFRDSFGSSIAPLLVGSYKTVTVVDIRYISSGLLDKFMTFSGQDVLFLYSTIVLNSGGSSLLP